MKVTNLLPTSLESRTLDDNDNDNDDNNDDNEIEVNNDDYSDKINDTTLNLNNTAIIDDKNINSDDQI